MIEVNHLKTKFTGKVIKERPAIYFIDFRSAYDSVKHNILV